PRAPPPGDEGRRNGGRGGYRRRELTIERVALDVRADAGDRVERAGEEARRGPREQSADRSQEDRDRRPCDDGAKSDRPGRVGDRDQHSVDENQPLGPVDPDRPVEIRPPRPSPRDVGVAALVRADAAEKGKPKQCCEQRERRPRGVATCRRAYWLATSRRKNTRYAAMTGMKM